MAIIPTAITPTINIKFLHFKKEFYLFVSLAIALITVGLIDERKVRYKKNYPKV